MKHKLSSKLISVLLAVIMVVSIVPVGMIQANAASTRQTAVDYMNQMATVRWTATGTWKGANSACTFVKGTSYTGIPYSQSGPSMDLAAFLKYNGRVSSQPGRNDCSSAVWFAWRAAGYQGYSLPFNTSIMRTGRTTGKYGIQDKGTNYASLLPGDALVNGSHAMLVVGNNPSAKKLTVTHNTGSFSTKYNHPYSSWAVNQSRSYSELRSSGFNGVTCSALSGMATTPPVTVNTQTASSTPSYYYNASARYDTGTYKCTYKQGVNIRKGASTRYSKVGLVAYNTEIYISSTNGNWGYGTYAGKSGWVCLDYLNKIVISIPAIPSTPNVSAADIAKGKNVTISWGGVSGASGYKLAIRGAETKDIDVGNTTSYTYQLNSAATYNFHVLAYNVSGSSAWSGYRSCTAHNPVTVNFVDWDDSPLTSVQVTWGESAKAPDSPYRKGYTFQGWNDSYFNVKSNKIIKATYKINTYIINFFDREGVLIDSQKVTYGSDATPPTDTHATGRYEFKGWSSTDYIDVYTDRADKNINIDGIYAWDNYDLPVECTVKSAERQYDGYTVVLDIENNDSLPATGRAVVALKTAEGKLVDMTESTAFSIKAGKTKSDLEVFLPCTNPATQAEVFMVANYSSGVPISSSDTKEITRGVMYAESTVKPDNEEGTLDIQEVTQYRYRDKEKTTGNSKTLDGWTWDETRNTTNSGWSAWSWNSVSKTYNSDGLITRDVKTQQAIKSYNTKTQYRYSHWTNGSKSNGEASMSNASRHYTDWLDYAKVNRGPGNSSYNRYGDSTTVWGYCNSCGRSYFPWYNQETRQVNTSANYATQYSYINYTYTYNFYRWKPWTDWSDTEVTSTGNRDVQTRTIYRYQSNVEVPEDNSGVERQYSGNLGAENAGKQVTLYVYGYTGASDYTNEYIGQTTVESDGHYSFTYKLREEPTIKTGDFTVAIGVEGSSDIKVVDTIEAPKPVYTVNFYDWDGTIISSQQVEKGDNATPPTNPAKEGFKFLGWDKSVTNITEDTDIFADFEREEYTVVFVDWQNQTIKMEKFNYGDVLVPPEAEVVEGYDFIGWDVLENGKQYVTEDMIVTAQYEKKEYSITFVDENNDIVDSQNVLFGENAIAADDLEKEGLVFAGWYNPEEYQNVKEDAVIIPSYYFEETTPVPEVNHESGEYRDNIQLTLSSEDENSVIYYYLNGDETTEHIYTKPLTISKTCSVTYHAESLGKNNSYEVTQYYCINTSDKPSEWMPYSELPEDVKSNPADFTVEQETGYSYKDVETTSSAERIAELSEDGWTMEGVTYTEYTSWQDEAIEIDSSKLGFEIDKTYIESNINYYDAYRYSRYKYYENGELKYAPNPVDGKECEYEEVIFSRDDNPYRTVDFMTTESGQVSVFAEDLQSSEIWFWQTKMKTKYRSRYKVAEYYRWTDWTVEIPSVSETREQKTDNIFRYYNKNYHIITVLNNSEAEPTFFIVEHSKLFNTKDFEREGSNLEGLYSDEFLTTKFELSTPITESITLYANFTPKQYTVTFQMQDGTELDTQTVDYMTAATAPDTDSVPGWVFAGWDKDFSSITEDTVVTGRYVRESEYARISLPRSTYNMYSSTKITLEPTITPENLSESKVEWTSSDTSVAIVDENGNVTAVGAGEAIITVTVLSSREKAECKVIVKADLATTITLKSNSKLNYDDLGFLRRIKYRTDVDTVAAEFENSELSFYKVDGTKLAGTDFVGTGAQIKLFDGDNVIDSKTVVVTGDLNGDGIINNRDVAVMNRKVAELIELEDYQAMAFDANGDGSVDNKDAALIARFLVGKEAL